MDHELAGEAVRDKITSLVMVERNFLFTTQDVAPAERDTAPDGPGAVLLAALDAAAVIVGESEERSVGEVVVHELSPLHHVAGVRVARRVHVRHEVEADEAGGGQLLAPHRGHLAAPHPVLVLGQQHALERRVGR